MKKSYYLKYIESKGKSEKVSKNKKFNFNISVAEILDWIKYLMITILVSIGATALFNQEIRIKLIEIIKR